MTTLVKPKPSPCTRLYRSYSAEDLRRSRERQMDVYEGEGRPRRGAPDQTAMNLPAGLARLLSMDGVAFHVPRDVLTGSGSFFSGLVSYPPSAAKTTRTYPVDMGSAELYHTINYLLYRVVPPCTPAGAERLIRIAEAKCLFGMVRKLHANALRELATLRPSLPCAVTASMARQLLAGVAAHAHSAEALDAGVDTATCLVEELLDPARIASRVGPACLPLAVFAAEHLTAYGSTRWPQERLTQLTDAWDWVTEEGRLRGITLDDLRVVTDKPQAKGGWGIVGLFALQGVVFHLQWQRS